MSVQKLNLTNVQKQLSQTRVKPTVATILRERKVVDSRYAIERQELENLMTGGLSAANYKYWADKRRIEEELRNDQKIEQRKLQAKEANQRILDIARQKLEEKRRTAQHVREQKIELKQKLQQKNLVEMDCAKDRVDKIMLAQIKSQIAVFKKKREKELNAQQVQKRTDAFAEEVKKIKALEESVRKDKIKKIQAAAIVSHKTRKLYNSHEFKSHGQNANCEMSDSEAKLRIYFQKHDEEVRLSEIRDRVKAEKECKNKRLEEAIQKISAYHDSMKGRQKHKM